MLYLLNLINHFSVTVNTGLKLISLSIQNYLIVPLKRLPGPRFKLNRTDNTRNLEAKSKNTKYTEKFIGNEKLSQEIYYFSLLSFKMRLLKTSEIK